MPDAARLRAAALATAALLFGAGRTFAPAEAARAQDADPARTAALTRLVLQDCGSCHGMTLKGGLGPDLRPGTLDGASPETLAAIILDGVPGTAMPPWRPLMSEEDALWISEQLLTGGIVRE